LLDLQRESNTDEEVLYLTEDTLALMAGVYREVHSSPHFLFDVQDFNQTPSGQR
jgi:hypothetical protein